MKTLIRFLGTAALRAWVAFCVFAIAGFVLIICVDNPDPLRRDDAYCIGFFFGFVAAGLTAIYSAAEGVTQLIGRPRLTIIIYALALVALCLCFLGYALLVIDSPDPDAYAFAMCGVGLGVGLLVYPFCPFKTPRVLVIFVSCLGVLFLVAYSLVSARIHGLFDGPPW